MSPTVRRLLLRAAALAATAGILVLLCNLPYGVLRAERVRAYGEIQTRGLVESYARTDEGWLVLYHYRDQHGLDRSAEAPVSKNFHDTVRPGDLLPVYYAKADPRLSRIQGQLETPFQAWLRNFLAP